MSYRAVSRQMEPEEVTRRKSGLFVSALEQETCEIVHLRACVNGEHFIHRAKYFQSSPKANAQVKTFAHFFTALTRRQTCKITLQKVEQSVKKGFDKKIGVGEDRQAHLIKKLKKKNKMMCTL